MRNFVRYFALALGLVSLLFLALSAGRYSLRLHNQCEVLISRGALEVAFSDYSVRSHTRDSWYVGTLPGFSMGTVLAPRTFWYPTVSDRTLGLYGNGPAGWQFISPAMQITVVHVPLAVPTALVLLLTFCVWFPVLRRKPAGMCRECGYNLTGNVSGRCPECGRAVRDGVIRSLLALARRRTAAESMRRAA